jgi:YegS/Rv2252/BmrU family lipid kinase
MSVDGRWLVIVNPASGRPDGGHRWRRIESALRDAGLPFEALHTRSAGDGEALAREALLGGCRRIVAAGGDGSVNEVLQGIMGAGLANTCELTLGVIPTGTGNDWARTLGMPRDPADVARVLVSGHTVLHDVGAIDFAEGGTRRWFVNVAGAGYDAWVVERLPRPVSSSLTYIGVALRGLAGYEAPHFTIEADAARIEGRLLLAFVANARYCGNRMHVAPTARIDDGELDLLAVHELSRWQVLPKLVRLYSGLILDDPAVRHLRAARVRITSDPPAAVQADGQVVGRTPAVFSLRSRALRVLVP